MTMFLTPPLLSNNNNNNDSNNNNNKNNNKLMISRETMRCPKVTRILRYHMPNKLLSPEESAHNVMLCFSCL